MAGVLKVGLMGCGAIGTALAKYLDKDERFELSYLLDNDMQRCEALAKKTRRSEPACVLRVADMEGADLVIESASQECVAERAPNVLERCDLMIMSVGALSDGRLLETLLKKAEEKDRKIYVPSGAISGLDGIKAACRGNVDYVRLTTRKPPKSLEGAPGIKELGISLGSIRKPTVIFEGSARQAARLFPRNMNVSIALSLAGIGADRTKVRIMADPFIDANVHEIEAEGTFGKLTCRTENVPTPSNSKTSYLAALSAMSLLDQIAGRMKVGS
jgi:aspartate dehydrogenase